MTMVKDYSTKNESFIKTVALFDKMELDNKDFCLTLLNKDLLGVDPYNPNLPDYVKEQIIIECKNNIWYFLREVVKVPTVGCNHIPLPLNIANATAIWQSINSVDSYLLSPSRTYRGVTFTALALWFVKFRNQSVTIFNNTMQGAERIDDLLKSMKVPDYIDALSERDKLIIYPKDTGILDELLQNDIQIFLDVNALHYLKYVSDRIETKYKKIKPIIMEEGTSCFRLYVYGGIHSYGFINDVHSNIEFVPKMIDNEQDNGYINGRDGESVSLLRFDWRDMGLDEDWYNYNCKSLNNDPFAIARELDLDDSKIEYLFKE